MSITTVSRSIGNLTISLETGRVAQQAGGAVIVRVGDTMILATATAAQTIRTGIDFFPLLVDYEEKMYAVGRIPGGFFRREGRPTEKSILTSRLIDRPLRPLFPHGYRNDVQIVVTPWCVDSENPPDVLAVLAASTALAISDVPFEDLVGAVRVAQVNGEFVINPTYSQMSESKLDLVVAGTADAVVMVEAGADLLSEEVIIAGIEFGHKAIRQLVELQQELKSKVGKTKLVPQLYTPDAGIEKWVGDNYKSAIQKAMSDTNRESQQAAVAAIEAEIKEKLTTTSDAALKEAYTKRPSDVNEVLYRIKKKIVRSMILDTGKRPDGRALNEIRTLSSEVGVLPRAHGSGIFTRGQTQVLSIATLGGVGEQQRIEGLAADDIKKRYLHHYNFPAYSTGEVKPQRSAGRREIGHGALAERALIPVLPDVSVFPYTIRIVSEVLSSNGSTSMASTCGSTLALMDAGVPIVAPVGGIAMGLIKDGDKVAVLSDIQGLEDHLGDMDFKVTGTKDGVTAIQMDMKIKGISMEIIKKALSQAREGRLFILESINKTLSSPRGEMSPFAPRVITVKIPIEKIGALIGPGGKNIRKIIEETGATVDVEDDGSVFITTADGKAAEEAKRRVELVTFEPELGRNYTGKVTRIMNFGAFVELAPGKEGLVHISHIAPDRVEKIEDVVNIGDEVQVKVVEIDDQGRINLSRRAILDEEAGRPPAPLAQRPPRRPFGDRSGGGRPPRRDGFDRRR